MRKVAYFAVGAAALAVGIGTAYAEPKTNMLHQWATGSDAAAIAKLGEMFTAAGGVWEQTAIAGHTANTLAKLRADVVAGNAPPAVQLKGPEIAEWNETGGTANIDELAAAEGWDKVVAPELLPVMKPDGHWVAAPMNIHRINWLWGNKACSTRPASPSCRRHGPISTPPATRLSPPARSASSHLSADWTDATTFEIDRLRTWTSTCSRRPSSKVTSMRFAARGWSRPSNSFARWSRNTWIPAIAGRDYDAGSNMMAKGDAAFFIMGDWEIGMLQAAGFKPGADILCGQAPTDWGKPGFILNSELGRLLQAERPRLHRGPEAACEADPFAGIPDDLQPGKGLDSGPARRRSLAGLQSLPADSHRRTCKPRSRQARWSARWRTT